MKLLLANHRLQETDDLYFLETSDLASLVQYVHQKKTINQIEHGNVPVLLNDHNLLQSLTRYETHIHEKMN